MRAEDSVLTSTGVGPCDIPESWGMPSWHIPEGHSFVEYTTGSDRMLIEIENRPETVIEPGQDMVFWLTEQVVMFIASNGGGNNGKGYTNIGWGPGDE